MKKIFRLGTRGSPLALIQAESVRAALLREHPGLQNEYDIELVPIRTTGDWRPEMAERTLAEMGVNKGLFTKEIDEALLSGYIDAAVHSMKDMATVLPEPIELVALLERADPRDAFIAHDGRAFADLPLGATVGTASLRRRSQVLAARPDLKIVPLRGNVETRLQKLADGVADATILAMAGLQRLALSQKVARPMETDLMLPAAAQGAIGVVALRSSHQAHLFIEPLNHKPTSICVSAERALLKLLDGSCRTPIAGLARLAADDVLVLDGLAARPDGTDLVRLQLSGPADQAEALGTELGQKIKSRLPANFFCA